MCVECNSCTTGLVLPLWLVTKAHHSNLEAACIGVVTASKITVVATDYRPLQRPSCDCVIFHWRQGFALDMMSCSVKNLHITSMSDESGKQTRCFIKLIRLTDAAMFDLVAQHTCNSGYQQSACSCTIQDLCTAHSCHCAHLASHVNSLPRHSTVYMS